MTTLFALFALLAQDPIEAAAPVARTAPAMAPTLPEGARIVHAFTGRSLDNLGSAVSPLGDVDGDGVPDLLVGANKGAHAAAGLAYAVVYSGASGARLYRVSGRGAGDAFGSSIAIVGDVNDDGAPDFAVGARLYDGYQGYVTLYSGADGAELHTWFGDPRGADDRGYAISVVGDVDRDGVPDVALGGGEGLCTEGAIYSGATRERLTGLRGAPIAPAGDADGDGIPDVLVACNGDRSFARIVSGADGRELRVFEERRELGPSGPVGPAGDVDRDGVGDVIVAFHAPGRTVMRPPVREERFEVRVISGATRLVLLGWTEVLDAPGFVSCVRGLGDLDGDGHPELAVTTDARGPARLNVYSGADGELLHTLSSPDGHFASRLANAGDVDGDGRPDLLIGECESQAGAERAGRAYVIALSR